MLQDKEPESVNAEAFQAGFLFFLSYMKKVMFLPGNCDHWNSITNMGFASTWAIPRQQVMSFAEICQNNMMFILNKSFYLNTSWGQTMAYKALQLVLDPVTKKKINITSENTHPDLHTLYHPCQLEKRFGGAAESPVNFWPPYIGPQFIPEDLIAEEQKNYCNDDQEYAKVLENNPLLIRHPKFLDSDNPCSRDFKIEDVKLNVQIPQIEQITLEQPELH